jgi:hypothetical protein
MAETHATLSPSSADRWMTCPGSVPLSEGIVDTSSEYAAEGSAAHEIAALCLTSGSDAAAYVGRIVEIDAREIEITADMAEHIQVYVDHVRSRVADWQTLGATVTLEVEQRVPIGHLTGEDGAEGTADAVIIAELPDVRTAIEVIDLKFGRGVEVEATDNRQLRLYALGAIEKFGMVWTFTEARVAISQPRLSTKPAEWEVSIEDLERFGQDVKRASASVAEARICFANKSPDFDLFLQPSEKACKWCKVKGTCKTLAQHVTTTVLDDFEDLSQGGVEQAIKDVPTRPDENLAQAMACVNLIEDWCKAVRADVERRLLAGGQVPGFKLVEGRAGARRWVDDAKAEAVLKSMRLKQEDMYDFTLINPTRAEKLAKTQVIGPRQWPKVEALITRSAPKPSVAPASDKRAALAIKPVLEDFGNLEEVGGLA